MSESNDVLEVIVDRGRSMSASFIPSGSVEDFATWIPALLADATACNAFNQFRECRLYLTAIQPYFAAIELARMTGTLEEKWGEATPDQMSRLRRTARFEIKPVLAPDGERFGLIVECDPPKAASFELFDKAWKLSLAWIAVHWGEAGLDQAEIRFNTLIETYLHGLFEPAERGVAPWRTLLTLEERDAEERGVVPEPEAVSAASQYCTNCGVAVDPEQHKFCAKCGTAIH